MIPVHLIPRIIEFLGYIPFSGEGNRLGQRIVEMRRALGLRQEDLALQLRVDPRPWLVGSKGWGDLSRKTFKD